MASILFYTFYGWRRLIVVMAVYVISIILFLNGVVFGEKYSIMLKKLKFIYLVYMTAILKSPSSGTLKYNRLGKPNISNVLGSKKSVRVNTIENVRFLPFFF